ncbi:protoporphyrinogen/coproporphyrinogen oxidase [Holophaga foetida]|uniref:protoporphyrinogen/coproporphyrinogen oxidase n=1 Tax=Holophaga foetida TaxID=35839 RepID=UPI000247373B|nr:FAD-dependent oxidoreductase [Holophaga foetida]
MSTLVLGAGISGLLAAWHLHRRGESVEVWEAESQIGGWMQTLPWPTLDGREGRMERGPQGLLVAPGSATDLLFKELGLSLNSPGKGARWVGKGQGLISVPAHPMGLAFTPLMSIRTKLRMALEPFQPVRPAEPEESLYDFIARRAGKGMADELLAPMVAGILAAPPKVLSVDAIPKLRQWEAFGSLFNGVRKSGISHLMVPEGGMGSLPKRLAEQLPQVRTGLRATGLEPCASGWRVKAQGESREVAQVILGLPAFEAAALLAPVAPASALALESIPYTSVKLWHSRHAPLAPFKDGFGFLIDPEFGRPYLGTLVPSWIDPGSAPSDLMQLRSFIGDSALWEDPEPDTPKDWLWTARHLRRWLPELGEAFQTHEEISPNAIPRPVVGHRTWVREALEGLPKGLDWISNARFGVGARDVIEGVPEALD